MKDGIEDIHDYRDLSRSTSWEICQDDQLSINLSKSLDTLFNSQRENYGSSPPFSVKDKVQAVCFDEIVQLVTMECPEQGTLLLRVRDELSTACDTYKTLYESSVTFGIQKVLGMRHEKENYVSRIYDLEREKKELLGQVKLLKTGITQAKKAEITKRRNEMKKYKVELKRLRDRNDLIKEGLEKWLLHGHNNVADCVLGTEQ